MQIFFARHGESQANVRHEISNHGLKHPLTRRGREQAALLARSLEGRSITSIYSSPVLRAIETSVIVANHLGIEYEVSEALREVDVGILEGRLDEEAWRLWRELFEGWATGRRREERIEGGESFCDIRDRFVPFLESLLRRLENSHAGALCIAHGGLYWMMLPLVLRNVEIELIQQHGLGYTTLVVAEPRLDGLVCTEWNGVRVGLPGQDGRGQK